MGWGSSKGGIGGSGTGWSGSGNESRSQAAHNGANVGRSSSSSSGSSGSSSRNSNSGTPANSPTNTSVDAQGRRGLAQNAFGGMDLADPSSFGLSPESVNKGQQQYGGVLDGASSGIEGYGIGQSMPGMPDKGLTAQETSRGGALSGSFDKGYGLESAVSEIGKNSRRGVLGQLAHEAKLGAGATKARDTSMLSNITMGITDFFTKPDDPVSRASFEEVRDHGMTPTESVIGSLAGYALNSLGAPGLVTSGIKAAYDAKKQIDYANTRYGLPSNDRRNTATDVFGSRSNSGSGNTQELATTPASTPANTAPERMAMPDYGSWNFGTYLNQFSA